MTVYRAEELPVILMHQGGWDEIAVFLGPVLIIALLVVVARRQAPPPEEEDGE
ncbi:hypothetical protein [Actinokineospora spheciospongiae]|uniref:hypothetical protein n=1 Tax=Actinokineospora spheciospongiae TaxID=909613 RepID=UPI0013788728|nr:hypothetical protein [Actinokineospora spheciospongiae]